jgi:hypothetical protein
LNSSTAKRSEAEIRDLQEKKNYQDFVYQTNQGIQNLQFDISGLRKLISDSEALIGRNKKTSEIGFEKIKEELDKNVADNLSVLNSFREILTLYKNEFERRLTKHQNDQERIEECERECDTNSFGLEKLDSRLKRIENYIESSIREVHGKIDSSIDSLRKDLTPIKPLVDPTEQKVRQLIETFKVDHQGVLRELEVIKKANNYNEKKIEKLLTDVNSIIGKK